MFALLGEGDGWPLNENAGGAVSTLIALELATHAHSHTHTHAEHNVQKLRPLWRRHFCISVALYYGNCLVERHIVLYV